MVLRFYNSNHGSRDLKKREKKRYYYVHCKKVYIIISTFFPTKEVGKVHGSIEQSGHNAWVNLLSAC